MKLFTPVLVALSLAASCGPPVVPPECEPGTRPTICFHPIDAATCDDGSGLKAVTGCLVKAGGRELLCVPECS